jgi:hypothetical protein
MKHSQKGAAAVTVLLVVIIVLIVGFGTYLIIHNNAATVQTMPVTTSVPSGISPTGAPPGQTTPPVVAVAGMKEYTDSSFGFSFWYPSTWSVTVPVNPPFGAQLQDATVVATLGLQPIGQTYPDIIIKEAHSTTRTITDTGGAGPIGPITYYFDASSHLWMTSSDVTGQDFNVPANISINTMGGLHMFAGTSRFDTSIIPLSADNFVVIGDGGGANATAVAKTVVATDPSVATPVSAEDQITTIQAEKESFESTN